MLGLSLAEVFVIAVIALLLFGDKNLSGHIKNFAHFFSSVKKTTVDMQRSWHEIRRDVTHHILTEADDIENNKVDSPSSSTPKPQNISNSSSSLPPPINTIAQKIDTDNDQI